MVTQTVDAMVAGGKASAAPPLGPALGPLGVNIGEVINSINEKTKSFDGMQVPVKLKVDTETKEYEIEVGTPPTSALIKKEAGVAKGSGQPNTDRIADLLIEQIIKISLMKDTNLLGNSRKEKVKQVIGTCNSMGILVEGVPGVEAIALVNEGKFDEKIKAEKTELSAEELKKLEEEKKKLAADIEKRRKKYEKIAKDIIAKMSGKARGEIKTKLLEAKVPTVIIEELLPVEGAPAEKGEEGKEEAPDEKGEEGAEAKEEPPSEEAKE
tara:strand:- start:4358 stop:5161 length:804 start_codon:yes stop_codon:yes gene_type:complete